MAEREWREASDMRRSVIGLALVLAVGAVLRFWALGHGIPHAIGVDEPEIMTRVVSMMKTGDFHPHFFDYPGLYFYIQLVVACARFIVGALGGAWRSLEQVGPNDFYLWARATTAVLGTATVLLVYRVGTRWGARHALLAGGLMAVIPLHVRESHYVLTDVPMTFFTTLAFLLALRAHEQPAVRAFAAAGAAAGLAAATKYNGVVAVTLPLIAAWMTPAEKRAQLSWTLASIGACIAAFVLAAPYTVLDLPAFLNAFAYLSGQYEGRAPPVEPAWIIYLKHLRNGLGWPALLLAGGGIVLGVIRAFTGPGRARWTMLVAFPLLFFYMLATRRIIFGRYLLPILPFVSLLAAIAVISGVSLLRRFSIPRAARTAAIAALTAAAVLPPAIQAVQFDRTIGRRSTNQIAYEWINRNIPPGSRVAVETREMLLPETRYRVEYFPRLYPGAFRDYAAEGFVYALASSSAYGQVLNAPQNWPERYAAYRRLFEEAHELARIAPSDEHPGPEWRIFKLAGAHRPEP